GGREPGFVRPGFRRELDELTDLAQGGRAAIAALEAKEKARTGIQSLKVRYNRVSGFYLEVTKANLHLVPGDYQRRSSTVGAERFITPSLAEHEASVLSAEERRAALELEIFEELRTAILERSADLRACAAAAAEADALLSFARIACECGWTRPWWTGRTSWKWRADAIPSWSARCSSPAKDPSYPTIFPSTESAGSSSSPVPTWRERAPPCARWRSSSSSPSRAASSRPRGCASGSSIGSSPASAPRTISRAGRALSWWRWRNARGSSTRRRRARCSSSTRSGAAPAPSTVSRWPGRSPSTCTTRSAHGRCSPRTTTSFAI